MYTLAITVFFFVFGISMLIGKGPNTAAYMAWWIFVLVLPSGLFPISAFVSEGSPLIRLVGLASAIAMLVIGGLLFVWWRKRSLASGH